MTKDYSIPRNHKDIGFRSLTAMFKDDFIPFTGIDLPKVKDVIQTNVPTIEVKDRGMDINFLLEDETIAHIEFESDALTEKDLIRFAIYDLELYAQHSQKIRRIVVFSSGVSKIPITELDIGSVKQQQDCIFLEHDFNGDEIYGKIKETILEGNPLTNIEKLQIIILPMMKSNETTTSKRAYELTETLQKYRDDEFKHYLIGAMVTINYSHIEEPEKAKILEVLRMAKPFEDLYKEIEMKGREEGKEEGRQEARKEFAKRLLQRGTDIEIIKEVVQLSDQEINELIQNQ